MKLIVDTCVWSLSLRRQDPTRINADERQILTQMREAIQDRRAVIIGPIRQEVLSGIRNKVHFARTEELLEPFRDKEIIAADYLQAARLFNLCRDRGVECGPVDILICAVAARKSFGVLTYDQGLQRCIDVLRAEALIA
jgi:predicted nucleic acid-binding protein